MRLMELAVMTWPLNVDVVVVGEEVRFKCGDFRTDVSVWLYK